VPAHSGPGSVRDSVRDFSKEFYSAHDSAQRHTCMRMSVRGHACPQKNKIFFLFYADMQPRNVCNV
jgi:hypothetical protein